MSRNDGAKETLRDSASQGAWEGTGGDRLVNRQTQPQAREAENQGAQARLRVGGQRRVNGWDTARGPRPRLHGGGRAKPRLGGASGEVTCVSAPWPGEQPSLLGTDRISHRGEVQTLAINSMT